MKVLGIDWSSKSCAYAVIENGALINNGELFFNGTNIFDSLTNARQILTDEFTLALEDDLDYIGIEKPVKVVSMSTAITLSHYFGVIASFLGDTKTPKIIVSPLSWQSYIGNPNIVGELKSEWLQQHPECKTKSQVSTGIRKYRKAKTIQWVKDNYNIDVNNDNESDAIGIASFVYNFMQDKHEES